MVLSPNISADVSCGYAESFGESTTFFIKQRSCKHFFKNEWTLIPAANIQMTCNSCVSSHMTVFTFKGLEIRYAHLDWPTVDFRTKLKNILTCIFLSDRVNSKETFQYETPCTPKIINLMSVGLVVLQNH